MFQQLPSRLAAEALFLGWWGCGDVAEFAAPSRAPVGCDGARDGILQIARFRFCLIDLIGGQGGIESAQIRIGGIACIESDEKPNVSLEAMLGYAAPFREGLRVEILRLW
jgi:hypothetical protein